jgi:type IV pilus assembly protein PilV
MLSPASARRRTASAKAGVRGATLIEVLVAVLIASLGLLAFAGITATSMRYTKMAQYRATATQLATDISERARANVIDGVVAGYTVNMSFADQQTTPPTAPTVDCTIAASSCTQGQMAELDVFEWRRTVRNLLPEGAVFLVPVVDPASGIAAAGAFDLWIAWRDPVLATSEASTVGAIECHNNLNADMANGVRCLYFRVKL